MKTTPFTVFGLAVIVAAGCDQVAGLGDYPATTRYLDASCAPPGQGEAGTDSSTDAPPTTPSPYGANEGPDGGDSDADATLDREGGADGDATVVAPDGDASDESDDADATVGTALGDFDEGGNADHGGDINDGSDANDEASDSADVDLPDVQAWARLGSFQPLPGIGGCVLAFAVGSPDQAWAIGCDLALYHRQSLAWLPIGGSTTWAEIAVSHDNSTPWAIDTSHNIFRWDSNAAAFVQLPGVAWQIGVGTSEQAFVIGGSNAVFKWYPGSPSQPMGWSILAGVRAASITVASDGNPWVIDLQGKINYLDGSSWKLNPLQPPGGCAQALGVDRVGDIWVSLCSPRNTNGAVYVLVDGEWTAVATPNGGGVQVAIDNQGRPWLLECIGASDCTAGVDWWVGDLADGGFVSHGPADGGAD